VVAALSARERIYIAGHTGLVGSALVRACRARGLDNLVLRTSREVDLRDRSAVDVLFAEERPAVVIVAAAKVGGILANSERPAEFLYDNLLIASHVIDAAQRSGVRRLLFLGSSCIYPKLAPQPIREESLLEGALEPTNEWYAVAKIAGLKLCAAYRRQYGFDAIAVMPTNLYGPGDNFDLRNSHVLPALIRKFHEAKQAGAGCVEIWGSGEPRREFLHADDLADACLHLLDHYEGELPINVGTGMDLSIRELAALIAAVVGFEGELVFDRTKPDGTPRKLLDVSRLSALGWSSRIALEDGIRETYRWYCEKSA
jgi:GDP-L-fucose synthase